MSSYAAIAGVSSTLRNLIKDRLEQSIPITIAPPDINVSGVSGKRLNIYLYQVTENPALRNQDFPKSSNTAAYGRPPLSLDLHYMITAFGGTERDIVAVAGLPPLAGKAIRWFTSLRITVMLAGCDAR